LVAFGYAGQACGQSSADQAAVENVAEALAQHTVTPDKALDPAIVGKQRSDTLSLFEDPNYELTFAPKGEAHTAPDGKLEWPVHLIFKSETKGLEEDETLEFVKRDGVWYFANYDFLKFPWLFWFFALAMLAYAVLTAVATIVLRRRLIRCGQLRGANYVKIFIPFYWPALFRLTREVPKK
jgi:hypothetical protein